MGFQSYNYYFNNKDELKRFIDAVNEYHQLYNAPMNQEAEETGEIFQYLFIQKLKQPYKRGWYKEYKNFFAGFGIGGGRSYCETFFQKRGMYVEGNRHPRCSYKPYAVFGLNLRQCHTLPSPDCHAIVDERDNLIEVKDTIFNDVIGKLVVD